MTAGSPEMLDAKEKTRKHIYELLYEYPEYSWVSSRSEATGISGSDMLPTGPPAGTLTHKPYLPPTPVNADAPLPFGKQLDAPLG